MTPEEIMALRRGSRLSLVQFSQEVGVSARTVSAWEWGTHKPNRHSLQALLRLHRNIREKKHKGSAMCAG